MKNYITTILICVLFANFSFAQNYSQNVRGTIIDSDTELSIIGAEIIILNSDPLIGTTSDVNGQFRLENIPIGRISIKVLYLGYESKTIPNVVINSGKETILNIALTESILEMEEVVVTASKNKGEALNEMALLSTRSISAEETNRYAGGFNDPSRITSNFAGVTNTQEGSNDIIVRGNAPKYMQWRLEGIQITNPNHFADQSAVGGAISVLNNNLLATSDFHTGAFTAEFGDVLSGVYDVKLRAGNNEQHECVFGFGLLGTDFTIEGPLKKGNAGSFLANYRYSTATLINELGLLGDVGGIPKFQDAAFKILLPTKNAGIFSVFGLGGLSSFTFEDVTPALWETPGNNFMNPQIKEDFQKKAMLLNTGITHTINLNKKSFLKTTLAYSVESSEDNIYESFLENDEVLSRTLNYAGDWTKNSFRAATNLNYKLSPKSKLLVGSKLGAINLKNNQSQLTLDGSSRTSLVDFDENITTIRNFVSWKYRLNEKTTFVSGIHNMNVLFNNKSTIEPRLAMNYAINKTNSIHVGYGNHSMMESMHHYFAKVPDANGKTTTPNEDLDLLKANHFIVGYEKRFGKNMRAKLEAYYQGLYNLPVENNDTSYFATINEGLEFRYVDLVNEGKGKNYGVELTIEKFFHNNYYYLFNASIYKSTYESLEGIERNTQYNGDYLVNFLVGKEFDKLGRKDNQTLGLNAKIFFGGGRKIIPLLRDAAGMLTVDPEENKYWDYQNAYEDDLEDIYNIIISASYKWNRPKATHELFLNLDNITNHQGKLNEFYDENAPEKVGYVTQFGFFPNLMYRVYF